MESKGVKTRDNEEVLTTEERIYQQWLSATTRLYELRAQAQAGSQQACKLLKDIEPSLEREIARLEDLGAKLINGDLEAYDPNRASSQD